MLTRPLTERLTKSMERLGSHIMKSKLTQSYDKRSVSFSGQPITAVCVPKPRKSSTCASKATLKKGVKLLSTTRQIVSMGQGETQLANEIQTSEDLQALLGNLDQKRMLIPTGIS
ncbi:hypothetical protein HOLleu_01705 [Holothuria leucospilota]|uniref:Uncharacterized protein n=1 Tax=Holothuria leucospilota TaxID=206669 RepID=A0A9Q1CNR1_HOLLE|nr:hypothetical protein HOLleu_01705 [Holothuria leucospilota]